MKKHLLLGVSIGMGVLAFGQNVTTLPNGLIIPKINNASAKMAMPYQKNQQLGGNPFEAIVSGLQTNPSQAVGRSNTGVQIGTTGYQLQTNASICNRIVNNSDGTISATWTMAQEIVTPWSDRGTGYNYFNGTSWGTAPTVRLESVRTGFTNIGVTSSGAEVIVSHQTATPAIRMDSRPVKGTGPWTEADIPNLPDTWARLAVGGANGHTLHVISSSGLGGGTTMQTYMGQTGSINYSRSLDGGITWDIVRYIIPQIDLNNYLGFGGDSYSIDAKGDTIAIVAGGFDVDVVLLKSLDNGTTWTKTIVKRFPIPMFDGATMYTDTISSTHTVGANAVKLETNDASVEVLLDNQGMAHVWYGKMVVFDTVPAAGSTQGLSYYPTTQGLMYWNESMGTTPPVMIASVIDLNYPGHPADTILNIDYYNGTGSPLWGFGSYQTSLTSYPSAGIDASGKIFLSYAGLYEGLNSLSEPVPGAGSLTPGKSYRHTYLMRSDDNGHTWCTPYDINDPVPGNPSDDNIEGVYGAMAKNVDGYVHLIDQEDFSPGQGLTNVAGGTTPIDDQNGGSATIFYYKIPVGSLACGVGVNDKPGAFSAINIYPNPASNSVSVKFNVNKTSKAIVKIYNVMGQEVAAFDNQTIANGTILTINLANYKSGIYFVNTVVEGKPYSQKLIVE